MENTCRGGGGPCEPPVGPGPGEGRAARPSACHLPLWEPSSPPTATGPLLHRHFRGEAQRGRGTCSGSHSPGGVNPFLLQRQARRTLPPHVRPRIPSSRVQRGLPGLWHQGSSGSGPGLQEQMVSCPLGGESAKPPCPSMTPPEAGTGLASSCASLPSAELWAVLGSQALSVVPPFPVAQALTGGKSDQ